MSMDLDSLLADLDMAANKGAPKSAPATQPASTQQQTKPSQGVAFDELESLMSDLNVGKANKSPSFPSPPPSTGSADKDKPKPVSAVESSVTPTPNSKPVVLTVAQTPSPSGPAVIDDLDALVESLDATAKEAAENQKNQPPPPSQQQQKPVQKPVQQPEPVQKPVQIQQNKPNAAPIDALDDLLGELNSAMPTKQTPPPQQQNGNQNSQVQVRTPSQPASQPPRQGGRQPKDELDGLLANLTSEMGRIDADTTVSRGICGRCGKQITGEVIQAMGKMWHPEHFTCASCKQPLGTATFYESDGQPNCDRCWKSLYCPRCSHCDLPIADRCITALGKKWHPEHFICSQCLKPLDQGFFERDGKPFCEQCFYGAFSAKCAGCDQPIRGECINALGQKWHPDHFVCMTCKKPFGSGAFFEYQGNPVCETHYYQMTGSLCAGCGKPVGTRSISALDKKWHPEHFVCQFCLAPLGGGSFKEQGGKAYCSACHSKLFG